MSSRDRVRLFDIGFDAIGLSTASSTILGWTRERESRIVVTPNVDHIVQIAERPELLPVYNQAALVLADGQPLIWAARLFGTPLPERVAGSDLFPLLLRDAKTHGPLRLFIFGGREQIAKQAQRNVEQEFPHVRVVGTYSPPLGFENRHSDNEQAVAAVAAADADIVLVALGAPRQELWCHRERARLRCGAALCLGATVDFVAGAIPRAPRWMRRVGLEWVFRVAREPRRLGARYSKDVAMFPVLVAREASARRRRQG